MAPAWVRGRIGPLENDVAHRPLAPSSDQPRRSEAHAADALLSQALRHAWWALLWERLWPPLAVVATALGVFLVASWGGLWFALPPLGRAIGVALLGLVVLASLFP